jgi:hypothetical protein
MLYQYSALPRVETQALANILVLFYFTIFNCFPLPTE